MIFLGDVAHPFTEAPDFSVLTKHVGQQPAVINLEGAISAETHWLGAMKLFNHQSVIASLKSIHTSVAVLANNHICDLPDGVRKTRDFLDAHNIQSVGAGADIAEASQPARLVVDGREVIIIAFGWKTIQCQPVTKDAPGVQPLDVRSVVKQVTALRAAHPESSIIPVFHWNYELEPHPQPAHRRLAFAAIDAGADAVIAHHPHCVGGFEFYRGKLVAHSIGNWWMPHGVYFDGKLSFPTYTYKQAALEWHPDRNPSVHWFLYDPVHHSLSFEITEEIAPSSDTGALADYSGFSDKEYLEWFKVNRLKRKALPIYKDPYDNFFNNLYDLYVKIRQYLVIALKKVNKSL